MAAQKEKSRIIQSATFLLSFTTSTLLTALIFLTSIPLVHVHWYVSVALVCGIFISKVQFPWYTSRALVLLSHLSFILKFPLYISSSKNGQHILHYMYISYTINSSGSSRNIGSKNNNSTL